MSVFSRSSSLLLGAALIAAQVLLATTSATAMPAPTTSCGGVDYAREVATNICEIAFQSAAEAGTFVAPAGTNEMGAILVGGGGGGSYTYYNSGTTNHALAGGGGQVQYVSLNNLAGTTFTFTPGAAGSAGWHTDTPDGILAATDGAATTLQWGSTTQSAAGGAAATETASGSSGGSGLGATVSALLGGASGGGASGNALTIDNVYTLSEAVTGGAGLAAAATPHVDPVLFPAAVGDIMFGTGGSILANLGTTTDFNTNSFVYLNAGFGGDTGNAYSTDGNDGAVYIRWNTMYQESLAPALASTGANTALPIGLGIGALVIGVALVVGGVLARNRRNK